MRKMKILITNNSLNMLAGSELFVYTLAKEFIKLGHEVQAIPIVDFKEDDSLILEFKKIGVKVLNSIDLLDKDYDVIHYQHNNITNIVNYHLPNTPKIFVSHGVYFPVCMPNLDIKFNAIVGVSKEIKWYYEKNHHIKNIQLINNPIDFDKFGYVGKKPDKNIKKVCFASNHAGKPCKRMGINCEGYEIYKNKYFLQHCYNKCAFKPLNVISEFAKNNKAVLYNVGGISFVNDKHEIESKDNQVWDMENAYQAGSIVFGIGRTSLQAMAMGIPTVVYDHFGYAGFINLKNFYKWQWSNFSGRAKKKPIGEFFRNDILIEKIQKEYKKINQKSLKQLSDKIHEKYDSKTIAKKYLALYRKCIKNAKKV